MSTILDRGEGEGDRIDGLIELLMSDDQRRLHAHDVAEDAADADEHSTRQAMIAHRFGLRGGRRQLLVFHQFDADHEAKTAYFADDGVIGLQ